MALGRELWMGGSNSTLGMGEAVKSSPPVGDVVRAYMGSNSSKRRGSYAIPVSSLITTSVLQVVGASCQGLVLWEE